MRPHTVLQKKKKKKKCTDGNVGLKNNNDFYVQYVQEKVLQNKTHKNIYHYCIIYSTVLCYTIKNLFCKYKNLEKPMHFCVILSINEKTFKTYDLYPCHGTI